jgi:transmembrane sensor
VSVRKKSQQIDDEAARWVALVDRAPLSTWDEKALETWLAADTRHLGAYARAQAIFVHTERASALGMHFSERQRAAARGKVLKRRSFVLGGAAAAAVGVGVFFEFGTEFGGRAFSTRRGETLIVPLEDGSVITLNTASKIAVNYTVTNRNVQLLEGEALFDVAKDQTRPFVVSANGMQVRAVGTSFTVQVLPRRPVTVLVREGIIELTRRDVPTAPAVQVAANTRAIAPVNAPIAAKSVAPTEVNRELNWRVGRIAFEGNTLREAAETFARYSDIHIVIDDPSIANETITGLFVANDPVGFSKAVAIGLNMRADVGDGEVRLSR